MKAAILTKGYEKLTSESCNSSKKVTRNQLPSTLPCNKSCDSSQSYEKLIPLYQGRSVATYNKGCFSTTLTKEAKHKAPKMWLLKWFMINYSSDLR